MIPGQPGLWEEETGWTPEWTRMKRRGNTGDVKACDFAADGDYR
jgi:hypothetical protein